MQLRDSLGRMVELPLDTHACPYRKETCTIACNQSVVLATPLQLIPPGSVLFLEIKHWKSDKHKMSTLAWSYAPLDWLVDFGPQASRVRGSVDEGRKGAVDDNGSGGSRVRGFITPLHSSNPLLSLTC